MNGPGRPALVGALVLSLAGVFPAARALAAPPASATSTCYQHTECTGGAGTSTDQSQDQYGKGFRQGLKDNLESCKKTQPQHLTQPDPNWQAGYDKGAETALNSKRCAA
ncbi:hypothetical protein [Streptomyces sp. NBC_00045]|uniref:hypothetical protein n=1 Tax=Streptomyces sp. NBC_00045 TaxID=2975625 RepID=UPI003249502D